MKLRGGRPGSDWREAPIDENHTRPCLSSIECMHALLALILIGWLSAGSANLLLQYLPGVGRWGLFGVWLVLAVLLDPLFVRTIFARLWPLLVFGSIVWILGLGDSREPRLALYLPALSYLTIVLCLAFFYVRQRYIMVQRMIAAFLIIDFVTIGIRTFLLLRTDPLISKYLATTVEKRVAEYGDQDFTGLAGYGYNYSLAAFLVMVAFYLLRTRRWKLASLSVVVSGIAFLVEAQFTIGILLLTIFLLLAAIAAVPRFYRHFAIIPFVLGAAFLLGGPGADLFKKLSLRESLSFDLSTRMHEISLLLAGQSVSGTDLSARFDLYWASLNAIAQHPVSGSALGGVGTLTAGGHAEWLDLMAVFGISSLFLIIALWRSLAAIFSHVGDPTARRGLLLAWAYFGVLGLINTLFFSDIFVTAFILLPFVAIHFARAAEKDNRRTGSFGGRGFASVGFVRSNQTFYSSGAVSIDSSGEGVIAPPGRMGLQSME